MNPDPAGTLLIELTRQGIELQAHGDKLRFRPRSSMAPELVKRVKSHKSELLAMLRGERTPQRPQDGQSRPTVPTTSMVDTINRPNAPAGGNPCDPPHEPSLTERVEAGYVNPGWTPAAWARPLQQLADRCEVGRPDLAETCRAWAANVQKRG